MTLIKRVGVQRVKVVGHTKFNPDSCFGLQQRFRRTHVQCLNDLVKVVNESAEVNRAKLVGTESGAVFVPVYDWLTFFAPHLKKVSGIKTFHQFVFSSSSPTVVVCKYFSDKPTKDVVKVDLLKEKVPWKPTVADLPPVIMPCGLSADRQWYLYEKIRPYCDEQSADFTCPLPSVITGPEELLPPLQLEALCRVQATRVPQHQFHPQSEFFFVQNVEKVDITDAHVNNRLNSLTPRIHISLICS